MEIIYYHDAKNPQSVELAISLNEIGLKRMSKDWRPVVKGMQPAGGPTKPTPQ